MSLKERQRQLREEIIIEAAYQLLTEGSYDAMNMDDVAATVGISKATLYQHFDSKEALASQVIARSMRMTVQDMMREANSAKPATERLADCLRASIQRRIAFGKAGLYMSIPTLKKHPEFCAARAELGQVLEGMIVQAQGDGQLDPTLSTPVLVEIVTSLFRLDMEELLASGRISQEQLVETIVRTVINGISARPA